MKSNIFRWGGWAMVFLALLAPRVFGQTPNLVGPRVVAADYLTNFVYDAAFAAEARAQGTLLFDGTTDQYGAASMNTRLVGSDNIGLDDFTFFTRLYVPTTSVATTEGWGEFLSSATPASVANSITFWRDSSGELVTTLRGPSGSDFRNAVLAGFMTEFAGRWVSLAWVRSGSTMTLYVNGTPRTMTETTSGSSPPANWAYDIVSASAQMGAVVDHTFVWRGKMGRWGILNVALSASEARDLCVQGVPQNLRTGRFRKKILNTLRNSTFTGTATDWGAAGAATVAIDTSNHEMDVTANPNANEGLTLTAGQIGSLRTNVPHRLEFELRNMAGGHGVQPYYNGGSLASSLTVNGKWWVEFTPTVASGTLQFLSDNTGQTFSVSNVQITELGLNNGKVIQTQGINTSGSVGDLLNGSFETAGGGGADVFGTWTESNTSSVWSQDGTAAVSGVDSAKLVVDGSNTGGTISPPSGTLEPQRRYRLSYWTKVDSITGTPNLNVVDSGVTVFSTTLSTSWNQSIITFIARSSTFTLGNGSGCAGRTLWIDDVKLEDLGAVIDIDCGPGVGSQAFDRSPNQHHLFFLADVTHERESPTRIGAVRGRTTTNGNEELLGGNCLPANARIKSLTVNASGSATVSVGTASAGTQIVNAASVVAGRQDLTMLLRYASTRQLWVNASAAVTLDWTVDYEVVE